MRIAIVEDHAAERQLMAVMCAEYFKRTRDIGVECVTFADAESFIESWKDARYDLLLLDCYLSDDETATHAATGLDIARTLRRQNDDCPIVFITSSTDFAVLGYEVQASGYLLKPLNHDAFHATMDRVAAQLDTKTPVTHLKKHQSTGNAQKQHGRRMAGGFRQSRHHHGPSPLSPTRFPARIMWNSPSPTAPARKSAPTSPMWNIVSPYSATSTAPREECSSTSTTCQASATMNS